MKDACCLMVASLQIWGCFACAARVHAQDPDHLPLSWNAAESAARLAALEEEIAHLRTALTTNPSTATACCPTSCGWYGSADYLNWKARRDGLDFATFDPGDADIPRGPLVNLAFPSDSGVRGRLVYRSAGGWDAGFTYTHFDTEVARSVSVPTDSGELTPILSSPYGASLTDVDRASASAEINYDVFDIEFGHPWRWGNCLQGRLFSGFRWAQIDQDFNVLYEGDDTDFGADGYSVQAPLDFDGYGVRLGCASSWSPCRGWGLFASTAVSMLVGDLNARYVLWDGDADDFDADQSNAYERVVPVIDVSTGFRWVSGRFEVLAGYEVSNWFNLVDSHEFPDDVDPPKLTRTPGDLSFGGFFARALFAF